MNNIQMKNEIPDKDNDTVKLVFDVTFDSGVSIQNGTVVITRADWLSMTGQQKLNTIAKDVSTAMLSTVVESGGTK